MAESARPGIFISARRPEGAKYPNPISLLMRWTDAATQEYLEGDDHERADLRESFGGHLPAILKNIEGANAIDWPGRSQASARGIVIELDEF